MFAILDEKTGLSRLEQCLKDIRRDWIEMETLVELLEDFGEFKHRYGDKYNQFCKAYTIMLIQWYVRGDDNREIMRVAYGLLQEFDKIGTGKERRALYVEKAYKTSDEKEKNLKCNAQEKNEKKIIEELAERLAYKALNHAKHKGTFGFAAEVAARLSVMFPEGLPSELPLPIPRYLKNELLPSEYEDIWEQQGNAAVRKITNLPKQNPFFHGREKYLKTIDEQFRNGMHMQGVFGIPGAGKTQLALQYAYTHLEEYGIVCWVEAENIMSIQKSVVGFLSLYECLPKENGAEQARQAFLNFFATHRGWLLIYNNAEYGAEDEYRLLESYIPTGTSKGRILLTTRCRSAFENAVQMEITVFDKKEAVTFFTQRAGIEGDPNVDDLVEKLGFLPLALEYAAAYIKETPGIDYIAYEKRLDSFGIKLLDRKTGHLTYKNTIRETFHITLDKLLKDADTNPISESIEQFLKLCAFLASDGIDFRIISIYGVGLPAPLGDILGDELDRDEMIRNLTRYSLLQIDGNVLSIHRLLQEILRDEMETDDRIAWELYGFTVIYLSHRKKYDDFWSAPWNIAQPFLSKSAPHMRNVLYWFAKDYQDSDYVFSGIPKEHILEDIAREYFSHTCYLLSDKGTNESESANDISILSEMIDFYDRMPTDRNVYLALALRFLGELYEKQGNDKMASEQYCRAIKITQSVISKLPNPGCQYLSEALRLASLICSFICDRSVMKKYSQLMWGSYRCLIRTYHIQVSGCPYDEEGKPAFLGTIGSIVSLSQRVADYTQRAFVLRLKDLPFMLRDRFGFFAPADNTASDESAGYIMNGFELILDGSNKAEISKMLNDSWTVLAFEKNIRTKEEILIALIGIKLKKRHIYARHSIYSAICVLAKELHREDVMRQYNEKLPSWLQYDV